ncbi:MAG: 3-deoxy-7-phosphoheptulonate synthase [SAR202 cluster bacterium]|jgi:3-deoxy-7-phosphoheptulonate synthase|nr:3-deoxy-7-phosphoheptulonate synthase [SAR202 cluster bacterium]
MPATTKDQQGLRDINVNATERLMPPSELLSEFPLTGIAEETVLKGREAIRKVLDGTDGRFIIIAGPCSIHDYDTALEYADRLHRLTQPLSDRLLTVMRVYFEKPRTTVGWKGLLYDPDLNDSFDIATGLRQGRSLLLEVAKMGICSATEFLDPIVPQYTADLVSWAAVGARTTESQTHRQMGSGLSMPVGFKNGTDGNIQIAIDAMITSRASHGFLGIDLDGHASVIQTKGNQYGHLVLRGSNDGPNYDSQSVNVAQRRLSSAGVPSTLLVDCSHGNCNKDHTKMNVAFQDVVKQRASGNSRLIGCMLESNINSGSQKLNGGPDGLQYGVSITDPCIGWKETEELFHWAHDFLEGNMS